GVLTIQNCTLNGNTAQGGNGEFDIFTSDKTPGGEGHGGAVFNDGGVVDIIDSTLAFNTAQGGFDGFLILPSDRGKGLGGAIFNQRGGEAFTTNATIARNCAADGGGGIYNLGNDSTSSGAHPPSGTVIYNTIISNSSNSVTDYYSQGTN